MARHIIPDTIERAEPRRERVSAPAGTVALNLVRSLRPSQWTKNLIIFAALMFGQRLLDVACGSLRDRRVRRVLRALRASSTSSTTSPIARRIGVIRSSSTGQSRPVRCRFQWHSRPPRYSAALTLAAAFWLRPAFGVIGAVYLALLAFYSGPLKHVVIIDVLTIAVGFVLRAAAGAVVIDVPISHWLLFLTILLALFLALSKRRHELVLLADGATSHRRILEEYSPYLLDQMIAVVTASTLVAYAIYTVSPETVEKFHTRCSA